MSKFKIYLEMAKSSEFKSGMMKHRSAIEKVSDFKHGQETFDIEKDGKTIKYKSGGVVSGNALKKGDIVTGSYNQYNQGMDLYEILGVTDKEDEKPNYSSVKEVMQKYGVTSLKGLEEKDKDTKIYLVVRDLEDGDEGAWFYVYKGRWCRGSGAEALTFTRAVEVGKDEEKPAEKGDGLMNGKMRQALKDKVKEEKEEK